MLFFKKKISKLLNRDGWKVVFMRKNNTYYSSWTPSGTTTYESFEKVLTSMNYVKLQEDKKYYECDINGKLEYICEDNLRFPKKES